MPSREEVQEVVEWLVSQGKLTREQADNSMILGCSMGKEAD